MSFARPKHMKNKKLVYKRPKQEKCEECDYFEE